MPHLWTRLLRQHFRSSLEVQVFFSVAERTADNWWHGCMHRPSGHHVALAAVAFPATFADIFRQAA